MFGKQELLPPDLFPEFLPPTRSAPLSSRPPTLSDSKAPEGGLRGIQQQRQTTGALFVFVGAKLTSGGTTGVVGGAEARFLLEEVRTNSSGIEGKTGISSNCSRWFCAKTTCVLFFYN